MESKFKFNLVGTIYIIRSSQPELNLLYIFRTAFHKNSSGWLLLMVLNTFLSSLGDYSAMIIHA